MARLGMRERVAVSAARAAAWASRVSGRGSGGMIGGRVASAIDPNIVRKLTSGMRVALVTGTNGKSTTTKMLNSALCAHLLDVTAKECGDGGEASGIVNSKENRTLASASVSLINGSAHKSVAWNLRGDNMTDGITAALITAECAKYASLEVDEMHLGEVAELTHPTAFIVLNLSRDQLDRVGEIATVERHIRTTLNKFPDATVVANCDDPLVASAAWDCPGAVWVSAGASWRSDATSFPRTGTRVNFESDGTWWVDDTYRRPQPDWWLCPESGELVGPKGRFPLTLALPGKANRGNAAQAVACAVAMGVPVHTAVTAVEQVCEVAGRYARYTIDGKQVRVLLAKNPAGWQEALTTLDPNAQTVIFAVNGQVADSCDLSWIWDIDFESTLHVPENCRVLACGERGEDLAVRLRYAGVTPQLLPYPWDAIAKASIGRIDVLANYTSFRDLKAHLADRGVKPLNGGADA